MLLKLLQKAEWPRVLTFSAPEKLVEDGRNEPLLLELVVTEPEIVRLEFFQIRCIADFYWAWDCVEERNNRSKSIRMFYCRPPWVGAVSRVVQWPRKKGKPSTAL